MMPICWIHGSYLEKHRRTQKKPKEVRCLNIKLVCFHEFVMQLVTKTSITGFLGKMHPFVTQLVSYLHAVTGTEPTSTSFFMCVCMSLCLGVMVCAFECVSIMTDRVGEALCQIEC